MAHFLILSKPTCKYCTRAKTTLTALGHTFEEIDVTQDEARRQQVVAFWTELGKQPTVPLIYEAGGLAFDQAAVGGYKELRQHLGLPPDEELV